MHITAQDAKARESAIEIFTTLNTTLYDLINVINEEVIPADDQLVIEIISNLFDRGLIKFTKLMDESETDVLFC